MFTQAASLFSTSRRASVRAAASSGALQSAATIAVNWSAKMPLFFLIILLFMPLADIVLALRWIFSSWAGGLYFLAAAAIGALMMKFAKIGFGAALRLLRDKEVPPAAIAGFAKIWVARRAFIFSRLSHRCAGGVRFAFAGRTIANANANFRTAAK